MMLKHSFSHFHPPKHAFSGLYVNVVDPGALKKRIIDASKGSDEDRAAVDFAFVDASLVRQ